jgi:hypothetical protein
MKNKKIKIGLVILFLCSIGLTNIKSQCSTSYNGCVFGANISAGHCSYLGGKTSFCYAMWTAVMDGCAFAYYDCVEQL